MCCVAVPAMLVAAGCGAGTTGPKPWGDGTPPEQLTTWQSVDSLGEGEAFALGDTFARIVDVWIPAADGRAVRDIAPPEASGEAVGPWFRLLSSATTRIEVPPDGVWFRTRDEYLVQSFGRDASLPAVSVGDSIGVDALPIRLVSGFDDEAVAKNQAERFSADDIRRAWPWWALAGVGVAVALGLTLWWRWRARRALPKPQRETPVPPHIVALRALERLGAAPRRTAEEVECLYIEVSGVLRQYFEDRFGLRAPERTTEEFLPEVESQAVLDATRQALLREFLQSCDMVKFAGSRPSDTHHQRVFAIAKQIVEATRPDQIADERPVASAASGAAAVVAVADDQGLVLLDPWFLALLLLPVLAWVVRVRMPHAALPAASLDQLRGLPKTLRQRLLGLPLLLQVVAGMLLAVALARPAVRDLLPSEVEGVDILLVIDQSASMAQADMGASKRVSRMEVARERAIEFALARENDRIGVVSFSRYADVRCPLTLDRRAAAGFLGAVQTVDPRSEANSTAIGVALRPCGPSPG